MADLFDPGEQPIAAPLPVLPGQRGGAPGQRRRTWWALPGALSVLFLLALAVWLQWSDRQEAEDRRRVLISDALSLQDRLSSRIDDERTQVQALAQTLAHTLPAAGRSGHIPPESQRRVDAGLRRFWIAVTLLDTDGRLLAHWPEQATPSSRPTRTAGIDDSGLSAHLAADLPAHGRLIVRYAPSALLSQSVPWWLGRKYEVRLVDGWGQNIASTGEAAAATTTVDSYRVSLDPGLPDAYLELRPRDRLVPWWQTLLSALMAVYLVAVGVATLMLRRQVNAVARAEAAWHTEAAWRRAMEDSLNVGLRARDLQGRLVYVNRAFCDQVGYGPEDLLNRDPPMPYWPADSQDERLLTMRRNLAGSAYRHPLATAKAPSPPPEGGGQLGSGPALTREGYEARWRRGDGQDIDVMVFEARLVDAQGEHIGWMGSTVDITERRRMEERERRQTETLAAQARLTTLGEVASALAHQLNQPLTAIAGYNAGVLRSLQSAGFADAIVLQAVQRLGEQANEAGRIVQRIRAFLTRRAPQREACDFEALARRAVALLKRDLKRQQVLLDWAVAPGLRPVHADPVLIEQVVINLLRNACDAMAGTGHAQPAVRIALSAAGPGFVRLDVDDAGPGLRGLSIEQLCAPFYSTKADGMGMGLAICRSVVEAHVGALDAGAGVLGGARLSFTLPVASAPTGMHDDNAERHDHPNQAVAKFPP